MVRCISQEKLTPHYKCAHRRASHQVVREQDHVVIAPPLCPAELHITGGGHRRWMQLFASRQLSNVWTKGEDELSRMWLTYTPVQCCVCDAQLRCTSFQTGRTMLTRSHRTGTLFLLHSFFWSLEEESAVYASSPAALLLAAFSCFASRSCQTVCPSRSCSNSRAFNRFSFSL